MWRRCRALIAAILRARARSRRPVRAALTAPVPHNTAAELPQLPSDLLAVIAQAALAAEGNDVRAWARLSLVNTVFRDTLKDVLLDARFPRPATEAQRDWLMSTRQPLRCITFSESDANAVSMLETVRFSQARSSLVDIHGVPLCDGRGVSLRFRAAPPNLDLLTALQSLSLCNVRGSCADTLQHLPASLRELSLDSGFRGRWHSGYPKELDLHHLTQLTTLTLIRCSGSLAGGCECLLRMSRHEPPALPASLATLTVVEPSQSALRSSEPMSAVWDCDVVPLLREVEMPMVHVRSDVVSCCLGHREMDSPPGAASRQRRGAAFGTCRVETQRIVVDLWTKAGSRRTEPLLAEELCRFFGTAPTAREFVLMALDGQRPIQLGLVWNPCALKDVAAWLPTSVLVRLRDLARNMQPFAGAQGISVRLGCVDGREAVFASRL